MGGPVSNLFLRHNAIDLCQKKKGGGEINRGLRERHTFFCQISNRAEGKTGWIQCPTETSLPCQLELLVDPVCSVVTYKSLWPPMA